MSHHAYLQLRVDVSVEAFSLDLLDILIELLVAKLVSFLVFSIVWELFLHGVVGEVNSPRREAKFVLGRGGPDVPVGKPVAFYQSVDAGDDDVVPEVEFPLPIEQRMLDV